MIVASGETERRALPHLLAWLREEGVELAGVRIPTRNRSLTVEMVTKLVRAAWFSMVGTALQPDKLVVLADADGHDPEDVLRPLQEELPPRLEGVGAPCLLACAQWHLEAWYFADAAGLRTHLERDLGAVDTSRPDAIRNPKQHLRGLLGDRLYTARRSEEIARGLDGRVIARRSPSFASFVERVRNGG